MDKGVFAVLVIFLFIFSSVSVFAAGEANGKITFNDIIAFITGLFRKFPTTGYATLTGNCGGDSFDSASIVQNGDSFTCNMGQFTNQYANGEWSATRFWKITLPSSGTLKVKASDIQDSNLYEGWLYLYDSGKGGITDFQIHDYAYETAKSLSAGTYYIKVNPPYEDSRCYCGTISSYSFSLLFTFAPPSCTDECTPPYTGCSDDKIQKYTCEKEGECYKKVYQNCGAGEECIYGGCQCKNECSSGQKECSGSGYKTCGNYDSDSCLEWSSVTSCGSNEECKNSECVKSTSEYEIDWSTKRKSIAGYSGTFSFYVNVPSSYSGSKLKVYTEVWTNPTSCLSANIVECGTGSCELSVTPGSRLSFIVSAYEWHSCTANYPRGNIAANIKEVATCTNECSYSGVKECSGTGYRTCGNYDSDSCMEWSSVTACNSGYQCSGGSCTASAKKQLYESCMSASECQESTKCYFRFESIGICCPLTGSCCTTDNYCSFDEECVNHKCVPKIAAKKADGQSCTSGSDCSSGNCKNSICCASGQTCCRYDSQCSSDYECGSSYYCIKKTPSKKANYEACSSNSDCQSNYCFKTETWMSAGLCCPAATACCSSDSDCGFGFKCSSRECVESSKKSDGESCTSGSECISSNCNNGYCCSTGTCCKYDSDCSKLGAGYACRYSKCTLAAKKSAGKSCSLDTECESGLYCSNKICCKSLEICCNENNEVDACGRYKECGSDYYCIEKKAEETQRCGDDMCSKDEDCYACKEDCLKSSECCVSISGTDIWKTYKSGEEVKDMGYCCNGRIQNDPCGTESKCGDEKCTGSENCNSCPEDCLKDKASCCMDFSNRWVVHTHGTSTFRGFCCNGIIQNEPCGEAKEEAPKEETPKEEPKEAGELITALHGNANYMKPDGSYEYPVREIKLTLHVKNSLPENVKGIAKVYDMGKPLSEAKPFWMQRGAEQDIFITFFGKEGESYDNVYANIKYGLRGEGLKLEQKTNPIKIKILETDKKEFEKLDLADLVKRQIAGNTGVYKTEVVVLSRIFSRQEPLKNGLNLVGKILGSSQPFELMNFILKNVYGKLYLVASRIGETVPALLLDQYNAFGREDIKEGDIVEVTLDTEFLGRRLNPGTFLIGVSNQENYISLGYSMVYAEKLSSNPFAKIKIITEGQTGVERNGFGFIMARRVTEDGSLAAYLISDMDTEMWALWPNGNPPDLKVHSLVKFKGKQILTDSEGQKLGIGSSYFNLEKLEPIGYQKTEAFKDSEKRSKEQKVEIGFGKLNYAFIKDFDSKRPALFMSRDCKIYWGLLDNFVVLYSSKNLEEGAKAIANSWVWSTDYSCSATFKERGYGLSDCFWASSPLRRISYPNDDTAEAKYSVDFMKEPDKNKNIIYITEDSSDLLFAEVKDKVYCKFESNEIYTKDGKGPYEGCLNIIKSPFNADRYMIVAIVKSKNEFYASGKILFGNYIMPVGGCTQFEKVLKLNEDFYVYKNGEIE